MISVQGDFTDLMSEELGENPKLQHWLHITGYFGYCLFLCFCLCSVISGGQGAETGRGTG